jgi:hypothetical protein
VHVRGESLANPELVNLRGQAYRVYDGAGLQTAVAYDFKGGLLAAERELGVRDLLEPKVCLNHDAPSFDPAGLRSFVARSRGVEGASRAQPLVLEEHDHAIEELAIEANLDLPRAEVAGALESASLNGSTLPLAARTGAWQSRQPTRVMIYSKRSRQ